MFNVTLIAETTPGPLSVICATFTGYRRAGILGALSATAGLVTPAFVLIYLISLFLDRFLEYPIVAYAFDGIKIGVGFLVLDAAIGMMKKVPKDLLSRLLLWGGCAAMLLSDIFAWNFSTISLMLVCAAISLAVFFATRKKGGEAK